MNTHSRQSSNRLVRIVNTRKVEEESKMPVSPSESVSHTDHGEYSELVRSSKVMMVDDEPLTLEVIQIMLEDAGYKNFVVTNAPENAMALLEKTNPDVVLLDVIMPVVNGFDILQRIRASDEYRRIPVIILTSSTDATTRLRALELGATDFLSKPVDPSELGLRLRNTLAAKAYQDQLIYFDVLTGLPNRRLFMRQARWAVFSADRNKRICGFLYIDVDRLKQVNDVLGLTIGDELLRQVSKRLNEGSRLNESIGRFGNEEKEFALAHLGGDEFAICLPDIALIENAASVAQRLLTSMSEPFLISGHELYVTLSIGISMFPNDGNDSDTLLKHADVAKHHAKLQGRNNFQFYSTHLNNMSLARLKLENCLRKALDRNELHLVYQPKVHTDTGEISGAEALVRWNSPEVGAVSPAIFIPLAEEAALIEEIGLWVLQEACRQVKSWQMQGLEVPRISVNLSSYQFRQSDLLDDVLRVLDESSVGAEYLTLEITEGTVMEDVEASARMLSRMKEAGLRVSIDDFGTGYSSLSYLKRFSLDELKIDRSFLEDVPKNEDAAAIVRAIIALSHNLGLSVVAEGVETSEQLEFLKGYHCDEYQGFIRSKPARAVTFAKLFLQAK